MLDTNIILAFIVGLIVGPGIMIMKNVYDRYWKKPETEKKIRLTFLL